MIFVLWMRKNSQTLRERLAKTNASFLLWTEFVCHTLRRTPETVQLVVRQKKKAPMMHLHKHKPNAR